MMVERYVLNGVVVGKTVEFDACHRAGAAHVGKYGENTRAGAHVDHRFAFEIG